MIDAHHHFWEYSPEAYEWIGPGMEILRRDFGPADLEPILRAQGVEGVVSVQARSSVEETDFLVGLARQTSFVRGVVGWMPLADPGVERWLEKFAGEPLVKGFRHVLQGEPDERHMLRDDFNRGVAALHDHGFTYDILIYPRHLRHVPEFVDRHPGQVFVLDHLAKPRVETDAPDPEWVAGLREVAKRDSVSVKVSGLVTEVVPGLEWTPALLRPYFLEVLEAFGADSVLFGSDWPVCLLRSDYARWLATVREWVAPLGMEEREAVLGGNATRIYGLTKP